MESQSGSGKIATFMKKSRIWYQQWRRKTQHNLVGDQHFQEKTLTYRSILTKSAVTFNVLTVLYTIATAE